MVNPETIGGAAKDDYQIHLNFLPVETEGLRFPVHRRKCLTTQEQRPNPDATSHKLPAASVDEGEWPSYWVQLDPSEGFEAFEFQPEWNADLTRRIVFASLKRSVLAQLKSAEYRFPENSFIQEVSLTMQTHPEGEEELIVQPYSLKTTRQVGFLVDFHFRLREDVPFSRRIQQLSLSLDRNFKRNVDYCVDRTSKIRHFLEKRWSVFEGLTIPGGAGALRVSKEFVSLPGGRVREHLREGVERAIPALANAIVRYPRNSDVRQRASSGELAAQTLYEELLRLVYRLLFLMVTEERNLLTENTVYRERYSISRLRALCENHYARNRHVDLWNGLQSTFELFHSEDYGHVLGVPPLNGDLFDLSKTPYINTSAISNVDFLNALWNLAMYREDRHAAARRINYSALDVEELGSVYESLLDLQPVFTHEEGNPVFSLIEGTERKTTGSYYTHPELVDDLIQSALVPVIEDRVSGARTQEAKEKALLEITVCDPASGSGHFLLAASRRLARELAQIRSGEDEPTPREFRRALRDVISHCIYQNAYGQSWRQAASDYDCRKPLKGFVPNRARAGDQVFRKKKDCVTGSC